MQAPDLSVVQQQTVTSAGSDSTNWSAGLAIGTDVAGCSALVQARLGGITCLYCGEQVGRGIGFRGRGRGDNGTSTLRALAGGIPAVGPLVTARRLEMAECSPGDGRPWAFSRTRMGPPHHLEWRPDFLKKFNFSVFHYNIVLSILREKTGQVMRSVAGFPSRLGM